MSRKNIRHSCGNVAFALMIVGFCILPLSCSASSCAVNHAVTVGAVIIAMISAVLAVFGKRCWVLAGAIVLFLLAPMFMCA